MWHPASLLLAWLGFVTALQWMSLSTVMPLAILSLVSAQILAGVRNRRMLSRARWLLLSLLLMFALFTPGEYLPGFAGQLGFTHEGLHSAGEHCARLIAMLCSLALLHEHIGTSGMLAGLYCLLGRGKWRQKTVVRLMLVLECVEGARLPHWQAWLAADGLNADESWAADPASCRLAIPAMHGRDWLLVGVVLTGLLAGVLAG